MTTKARHGHAMEVAGRGQDGGVEIGMGVQPENLEPPSALPTMAGNSADRTNGEAVVATQDDGQVLARQFRAYRIVYAVVPGHDFRQVSESVDRRQLGIVRAAQIATVHDLDTKAGNRPVDAGNPQRVRPHPGTSLPGADVSGDADDADCASRHSLRDSHPRSPSPIRRSPDSPSRER